MSSFGTNGTWVQLVGLHGGTHSKMIVLSGIFTIFIADAFSDALGIHVSKEVENAHSVKEVWSSMRIHVIMVERIDR